MVKFAWIVFFLLWGVCSFLFVIEEKVLSSATFLLLSLFTFFCVKKNEKMSFLKRSYRNNSLTLVPFLLLCEVLLEVKEVQIFVFVLYIGVNYSQHRKLTSANDPS